MESFGYLVENGNLLGINNMWILKVVGQPIGTNGRAIAASYYFLLLLLFVTLPYVFGSRTAFVLYVNSVYRWNAYTCR